MRRQFLFSVAGDSSPNELNIFVLQKPRSLWNKTTKGVDYDYDHESEHDSRDRREIRLRVSLGLPCFFGQLGRDQFLWEA
jgi:hypothetical protein